MMRSAAIALLLALCILIVPVSSQDEGFTIYFFYGEGCPHCADEKPFLDMLEAEHPEINVERYEVWHNEGSNKLMKEMCSVRGVSPRGVPVTIVGDRVFVGFGSVETTGKEIEAEVARHCDCIDTEDGASQDIPPDTYMNVLDPEKKDLLCLITGADPRLLYRIANSIYYAAIPISLLLLTIPLLTLHKARRRFSKKTLRLLIFCIAFVVIGLFLTSVLNKNHYEVRCFGDVNTELCSFADGRFDCAVVEKSRYSEFLMIPTSIWGTAGYALIYIMLLLCWNGREIFGFRKWMHVIFGISCFNIFIALMMAYISTFIIHAYCLYCIGTYVCSGAVLYLSWRLIRLKK